MKKLDQEEFIRRLLEKGYSTNDSYVNNSTAIRVTCNKCGNSFYARPMDIFTSGQCLFCGKYRRLSLKVLNSILPNEYIAIKKVGKSITFIHTLCGSEFTTTFPLFNKAVIPCPTCSNRKVKRNLATFDEKIKNLVGNEYTFYGDYVNNMTKMKVKHNICGHEYEVTPNKFINIGRRCPKCAGTMKKDINFVKKEINSIDSDYEVISDIYINTNTPIRFKHLSCGNEFMMRRTDFIKKNGNRCPVCNNNKRSHGESLISKYLIEHNIPFDRQYKLPNFKQKSFDFVIYDNNNEIKMLLEYDGEFHYKPMDTKENSIKRFENQVTSDRFKENYCRENNLKLIRIPYWYFDSLEKILDKILNNNEYTVMSTDIPLLSNIHYFDDSTTINNE